MTNLISFSSEQVALTVRPTFWKREESIISRKKRMYMRLFSSTYPHETYKRM